MSNPIRSLGCTLTISLALVSPTLAGTPFVRGDLNGDQQLDITDPVVALEYLFSGGQLDCADAADFNDDGEIDLGDAIGELSYLFTFGPPPPAPFPGCGTDPTADTIDCLGPVIGCGLVTATAMANRFPGLAITVGENPHDLRVGDVNGDGLVDVVTANSAAASVTVTLGSGPGTFGVPADFDVTSDPESLELADLDADGDLDIVSLGPEVNILLGDGAGQFALSSTFSLNLPRGLKIADTDLDGILDLVVVSRDPDLISVHLGIGDGTFLPAVDEVLPFFPHCLDLTDVDNDGLVDAVIGGQSDLLLIFGEGLGGFSGAAAIAIPLGTTVLAVATADVDDDGFCDVLVSNTNSSGVFLAPGAGTPSTFVSLTGTEGDEFVFHDLDDDGALDLISARFSASVTISHGDGSGNFTPTETFPYAGFPSGLALADTDGDGVEDLFVSNSNPETFTRYFGTATGSFETHRQEILWAGQSLSVGDMNGDGHQDLVGLFGEDLVTRFGDGAGGFTTEVATQCCFFFASELELADIDDDGDLDAVTATYFGMFVFLNDGGGTMTLQPALSTDPVFAFGLGDVNNDGAIDIVFHDEFQILHTYLNDGGGDFSVAATVTLPAQVFRLKIADQDGDGSKDILLGIVGDSALLVLPGLGDGTYGGSYSLPTSNPVARILVTDSNLDGILDVVVSGSNYTELLVGLGGGNVSAPVLLTDSWARDLDLADIDGDGLDDLVIAANHGMCVLRGDGAGYESPICFSLNATEWVSAADLDEDGAIDLIGSNEVSVEFLFQQP